MGVLRISFWLSVALFVFVASPLVAQESPEAILAEAESIYEGPESSLPTLVAVRHLLDRIVNEHPSSDLAISVLLAESVGEIDVAGLNARLENGDEAKSTAIEDSTRIKPTESNANDKNQLRTGVPPSHLTQGSKVSEAALGLDKQGIRDLQARLLVMGYDPNGVDGVIGRGTRSALSAWQVAQGVEVTGYLSADQHLRLQAMSEAALADWRTDPENERMYLPPPPIAIGPGNMSGIWRFTSNCGPSSKLGRTKITGVLNVRHAGGNRYGGRVQQSQGFRGQFSGRLNGRRLTAEINWGLLLGRVQVVGTVADQKLAMSGRDSNRCSFYAVKS